MEFGTRQRSKRMPSLAMRSMLGVASSLSGCLYALSAWVARSSQKISTTFGWAGVAAVAVMARMEASSRVRIFMGKTGLVFARAAQVFGSQHRSQPLPGRRLGHASAIRLSGVLIGGDGVGMLGR